MRIVFVALLFFLNCAHAAAATVYKVVDAEGNVSYSDHKPDASGIEVEEMSLPDSPDVDLEAERARWDKITEVADRLKQDRLDREDLELRKQELQQQVPVPPAIIVEKHHHYDRYPYLYGRPFPSIHQRRPHVPYRPDADPYRYEQNSRDMRDSGPVIVPKSRLLTPNHK